MFNLFQRKPKAAQGFIGGEIPLPVLVAAKDVAAKERMIAELRSLPNHGYAMLVTMIPGTETTEITCSNWPLSKDNLATEGFVARTIDYLTYRMNGHFG